MDEIVMESMFNNTLKLLDSYLVSCSKEDDKNKTTDILECLRSERKEVCDKIMKLQMEMKDIRSAASLVVDGHEDKINQIEKNHENEIVSLRSVYQERIDTLNNDWNIERNKCLSQNATLRKKLASLGHGDSENETNNQDVKGFPQRLIDGGLSATNHLTKAINRARASVNSISNDDSESPRKSSDSIKSPVAVAEKEGFVSIEASKLTNMLKELDSLKSNEPLKACEMCDNYEHNLQTLQKDYEKLDQRLKSAVAEYQRVDGELEISEKKCKKLEYDLLHRCETQKNKSKDSDVLAKSLDLKVSKLERLFQDYKTLAENQLSSLKNEHEKGSTLMQTLEMHYRALLSVRDQTAKELSDEDIHIPEKMDDLISQVLKMREELAAHKSSVVHLNERLKYEHQLQSNRLNEERAEWEAKERRLESDLNNCKDKMLHLSNAKQLAESEGLARQNAETEAKSALATNKRLEAQIIALQEEKAETDEEFMKAKRRLTEIKEEFDNAELVQKDFVMLSQKLQVELEHLRQREQEVRWQSFDEALECFGCKTPFPTPPTSSASTKAKNHCRHCVKVFCANCVRKTVPAGSQRKPAPVCDICHTLLVKEAAPFFSEGPIASPK